VTSPPHPQPRSLACLGDSGRRERNGAESRFHLFQARAGKIGFLTHTMNLLEPHYKRQRMPLVRQGGLLQFKPAGGYQFSRQSNSTDVGMRSPRNCGAGEILSHFQVFSATRSGAGGRGVRVSVYIDANLAAALRLPAAGPAPHCIDRSKMRGIRREREVYQGVSFSLLRWRGGLPMSSLAITGLMPRKCTWFDPAQIWTRKQAGSFLHGRGPSWREEQNKFTSDRPARLGFIGRDWQRQKVWIDWSPPAEILGPARAGGSRDRYRCHNRIICASHRQVELLGLISKRTDMRRFLEAIDSFALGCLPSYFEPLGIGTLECLRLGVPVMGADVGGIPDCIPGRSGFFLVPADADARRDGRRDRGVMFSTAAPLREPLPRRASRGAQRHMGKKKKKRARAIGPDFGAKGT